MLAKQGLHIGITTTALIFPNMFRPSGISWMYNDIESLLDTTNIRFSSSGLLTEAIMEDFFGLGENIIVANFYKWYSYIYDWYYICYLTAPKVDNTVGP